MIQRIVDLGLEGTSEVVAGTDGSLECQPPLSSEVPSEANTFSFKKKKVNSKEGKKSLAVAISCLAIQQADLECQLPCPQIKYKTNLGCGVSMDAKGAAGP